MVETKMSFVLPLVAVPASALVTVLAADLASGFVHWAEDAYARKDTPIIGKLVADANIEHHQRPREFLKNNWFQSSWDLMLLGSAIVAVAYGLDMLTWHVWLFAAIAANANQIHKWAHRNPRENGKLVTWLQKAKLLQTPRHHAKHHSGQKNSHYCAVTNLMNPVLDHVGFWVKLEKFNEAVFRLKRREDPTVKAR
jgi:plasmanylethanolamine desaturase